MQRAARVDCEGLDVVGTGAERALRDHHRKDTGGTLVDERREPPTGTNVRGSRIEGGVSRRVVPGDVVIIPGRTPHWWTDMDADIRYMIVRSDPSNRIPLKP